MEHKEGSALALAEHLLAEVERSGYGTDRPDRWTPYVSMEDVLVLARAVLTPSQKASGEASDG